MNFNQAAALAAAALAYQQQQPNNFLLNPSLLFNSQNLGSLLSQNSPVDNSLMNQLNGRESPSDEATDSHNQMNLMQQQMQLQMALAMAATSNQVQNNQTSNQQFTNILSDLYQQQQKSQQDQLLLAYLQQQNNSYQVLQSTDCNSNTTTKNTNNKRPCDQNDNENSQIKKANITEDLEIDSKSFKCNQCTSKFDTKKDLKKHARLIHKSDSESTAEQPADLAKSQPDQNNKQLHECFKCELIFRNYEMFCAHKMLHEMQDQKTPKNNTPESGDESAVVKYEVADDKQEEEEETHDGNTLLAQKLLAEQIQQSMLQAASGCDVEAFNCNQCGVTVGNALQYFMHVQAFHAAGNHQQMGDQIIKSIKQEV